jgi:adenylate cyclase
LVDGVPYVDQFAGTLDHFFDVALFHSFLGSIVSGLGLQVVKKYGRDVFVPMLLGFYKEPREEKRIFMFMDLKSSTTIAERLGHIRYSAFVRDFILDVNQCLDLYNANAYQYVGDEVVLTWRCSKEHSMNCIDFFVACRTRISRRNAYYEGHYGHLPHFKAGVECGIVTAVEIGDIKRDIAYHGDTLNTAARIQGMCNEVGSDLLVSENFIDELGMQSVFHISSLGEFALKGKDKPVEIFSVSDRVAVK